MFKTTKFFVLILLAFTLISCGGGEEKKAEDENAAKTEEAANAEKPKEGEGADTAASNPIDENMFYVEDLVVNPMGTAGRKILLTSFAIEVKKPNMKDELSNKKYLLNDLLIKIFGSKTVAQLSQSEFKDSLRIEIANQIKAYFPKVKVKNVYFSKFILQ